MSWTPYSSLGSDAWWGVYKASNGVLYAADTSGVSYIYKSEDNGVTWTPYDQFSLDRAWCGLTGDASGNVYAVANLDYVYKLTDSVFTPQYSSGSATWYDIDCTPTGDIYAVVYGGYIYKSTDGGSTWTAKTSAGSRNWTSIDARVPSRIRAVVSGGVVYESTDSGDTWHLASFSSSKPWFRIRSASDLVIYAIETYTAVWKSIDGGSTWTSLNAPTGAPWSISPISDTECLVGFSGGSVYDYKDKIPNVSATPSGGSYSTPHSVSLSNLVSDVSIHYTLDDSVPTIDSPVYNTPLTIYENSTLKVFAEKDGMEASDTSLFTYTITETIYNSVATVSLGSFIGVTYYTLDGSNPLDVNNAARRVYVAPFNVLPIASKVIHLHIASVRDGYKSVSTYPGNPAILKFSFECNPWKISDSTLDSSTAVVTSTGNLQINSGAMLERSKAISGDFYYQFNIVSVSGNGSLVFGMKSYLNLVNNLSEGEYTRKWPSPAITFIDKVGDVITCNIGYRYGLNDKNNFDAIGKFDWNVTKPLPVTVFVKDEINVPVGTLLYNANELNTRVEFTPDVNLDNMFGLTLNMANSVVVSNISSHSSRLIKLPNPSAYATGTKITITKHGHSEDSKLIIACKNNIQIGTSTVLSLTIEDNSSVVIIKDASGVWVAVVVTNLTTYTNTKKMKIQINGLETDYVPVSSKELDYVMFAFAEVSDDGAAYVEIGTISGGCL